MKKRFSVVFAGLLSVILVFGGCNETSGNTPGMTDSRSPTAERGKDAKKVDRPEIVLRYGDLNPESHPMIMAAREFAKIVEEKSKGRIFIEIYPSGQLGDEKTEIQSVQAGALDMFRTGASFLSDSGVKMMKVLELPYIFRDVDHAWNVLNSDIGSEFLQAIKDADIKMIGLGYFTESPRNFFFTDKKVTRVSEMKGLKIRVPQSEMYMDTTRAFGSLPNPMAFSELYSALQTGVVDGGENALTGYEANKFYEVAKYYISDGHSAAPYVTVFSEITWRKLSAEDQKLISDSWKETEKWFRELSTRKDEEAVKNLKAKGAVLLEVDDKQEWVDAVKPLYEKYGKAYEDLIKRIQETK